MMLSDELVAQLLDTPAAFDRGLRSFLRSFHGDDSAALQEVLEVLGASSLPVREANRRSVLLLRSRPIARPTLLALALKAPTLAPPIRQALVEILPLDLQSLAVGHEKGTPVIELVESEEGVDGQSTDMDEDQLRLGCVFLVGSTEEHHRNKSKLVRGDLSFECIAARFDVLQSLVAGEPPAAVLVGNSVWSDIPDELHIDALKTLLGLSSFTVLHIGTTGMNGAADTFLAQELDRREKMFEASPVCRIGASCEIPNALVAQISQKANVIREARRAPVHPAELSPGQCSVLKLLAVDAAEKRLLDGDLIVERIDATFLTGGRSGAKVVQVCAVGGPNLVVKFAPAALLHDEAERFTQHILPAHDIPKPTLHFHADSCALVFKLEGDIDNPSVPAVTMEQALEKLGFSELGWAPSPGFEEFRVAFSRCIEWLKALNIRPGGELQGGQDFYLRAIEEFIARGASIVRPVPGAQLCELAKGCYERVLPSLSVGIGHGDVHLGNILLRDSRLPCFIDFAQAGPSHPCLDLIRLEAFLIYRFLRVLGDEDELRLLFDSLLNGNDVADLRDSCPQLMSSTLNQVCVYVAQSVRTACLTILEAHRLSDREYVDLRFLVGAYCLARAELQGGTVRQSLGAMLPLVDA